MSRILMIGFHDGYAGMLARRPDLDAYVLDEPEFLDEHPERYASVPADHVLPGEYEQSSRFLEVALRAHRRHPFDAVVPAWDISVTAYGAAARALGLRYVGDTAISACTDKAVLRDLAEQAGVPQPAWRVVSDAADVREFMDEVGGPVIVKPTSGRASVGVQRIERPEDLDAVWEFTRAAHDSRGVSKHRRRLRYLAEADLGGFQVSVETFCVDGTPRFDNVCFMEMGDGPYFPILGVTVPAPIPSAEYRACVDAGRRLAEVLQVRDGVIHSEWRVVNGRPWLIECAARVPGAMTPDLALRAYDHADMYSMHVDALLGIPPNGPVDRRAVAGVRWFSVPDGQLAAVRGVEQARAINGVFALKVKVQAGDDVRQPRNNWERHGYVAAAAPDADDLRAVLAEVGATIRFELAMPVASA